MKLTTWKKLDRKLLLQHPRLTIYEDDVELPSGYRTQYIWTTGGDAVTAIAVNKQGQILVQREYSYPPNEWLYQFPGGKIEKGESPIDACRRELQEEADIHATDIVQLGWFYPDNRRRPDKFYVTHATDLHNAPGKADIEEDIESYWMSEAEIDELIRTGKFTNYSALAAWSLYKAKPS